MRELRVSQTGVQLLTGFLLTLPFQSRFEHLTQFQQVVYLITLSAAVISTGFLIIIAPVSLHRFLFRRATLLLAGLWVALPLAFRERGEPDR